MSDDRSIQISGIIDGGDGQNAIEAVVAIDGGGSSVAGLDRQAGRQSRLEAKRKKKNLRAGGLTKESPIHDL